ncbi:MAG: fatty acid desaturase, partial [Pseudomonadota bacterium]
MTSQGNAACSDARQPAAARKLGRELAVYSQPDSLRAIFEIAITTLPLICLWITMWLSLEYSYWFTLLLAIPTAGLLARMFMIQHDCGHGSFFESRAANDWTGRIIGVLTLTPYSFWKRTHAMHHAQSGNLDRRGIGDVETLTVAEYQEKSNWCQMKYRLYRHPLVLFGLGPAYLFLLQHRVPVGLMRRGWRPWISAMGTNLAIAISILALSWIAGPKTVLLIHLPVVLLAAMFGVWLFFVQHQFEETSWDKEQDWNWHEAALNGSSFYDLPAVLRWFTANIGMHHVHHLCGRIPFYKLPNVLRDYPELRNVSRLTFL